MFSSQDTTSVATAASECCCLKSRRFQFEFYCIFSICLHAVFLCCILGLWATLNLVQVWMWVSVSFFVTCLAPEVISSIRNHFFRGLSVTHATNSSLAAVTCKPNPNPYQTGKRKNSFVESFVPFGQDFLIDWLYSHIQLFCNLKLKLRQLNTERALKGCSWSRGPGQRVFTRMEPPHRWDGTATMMKDPWFIIKL